MLRFLDAGETHGKCLTAIIEGMPAGVNIDIKRINDILAKRQCGYGRGERMKIESDKIEILSGIKGGKTLGSPICMKIENRDWENWKDVMDAETDSGLKTVTKPRPGHADLAGALKYNQSDIRNILERSSARETAVRVAIGCIAEQFLRVFGIKVYSHVVQIGPVKSTVPFDTECKVLNKIKSSQIRCADEKAEIEMIEFIERAKKEGDSAGGVFEIIATGVTVGLGSPMHWDRKLDGSLAGAIMSIQAIKGVEIGLGFDMAKNFGSYVHDEIYYADGFYRKTNNAGGIEGGMSNGENIVIRAVMKPIPTLNKPLQSVDLLTKVPYQAEIERSDVCAVPAASIVGQSVVAWEIACAFVEKFGGDSLEEVQRNYEGYVKAIKKDNKRICGTWHQRKGAWHR